jgi:hypothetical protein
MQGFPPQIVGSAEMCDLLLTVVEVLIWKKHTTFLQVQVYVAV